MKTLRERLIERDRGCVICGSKEITVDHIIPTSLGGLNTLGNMQALCVDHHQEKTERVDSKLHQRDNLNLGVDLGIDSRVIQDGEIICPVQHSLERFIIDEHPEGSYLGDLLKEAGVMN